MSFAIEVPGEASPLSLPELCRILQGATSHDHSRRQAAGQQLTSWEAYPDYYPALQNVFLDKTLPHELRFLAIIQFKNGIDRYWRQYTLKNAIGKPQKTLIRSRLFEGTVGEHEKQFALHNALAVAKIVRIDYPQEWPEALSAVIDLMRATKDGDQHHLSGALLILLRVVKELGTARLRKSQTALQSVAPELVYILGDIYARRTAVWVAFLTSGQRDDNDADLAMRNSLMALKILRRLLIVGYEYPHKDKTVQEIWTLSQTQFDQFLGFISHNSPIPPPYQDTVGQHLLQFTKLHNEMSEAHPASFAGLPNSLDLVRAYWALVARFAEVFDKSEGIRHSSGSGNESKSKAQGPLLERLALKGLLLMRTCVRIIHYPQQTFKYRSMEVKKEQEELLKPIRTQLLTDDLVTQMANVIITHLFVFRKSDLEAWEEDPEEWEQQEEAEGNAWEWEVRPCAEKLFLDLLISYKGLLLTPLLSYFETARDPQTDIVVKEAVYLAMGIAAANVFEQFDFDSLLKTSIVNDAQQQGPLAKVLRRRIAILLSKWTPVKMEPQSRPLVYEIFRHFLSPADQHNDIVVRITAARQFKAIADEIEFDATAFVPFTSDFLRELIRLLGEVDIDETKLAIMETTRVIITRMEGDVTQFGDLVMSALPSIWSSAGELNFMLKQSVLTILQSLVNSMGDKAQRYYPHILPLIAEALTVGSDLYLYLIDEALELWTNVMDQSAPPLSPELLNLAEPAVRLLESDTEHNMSYLGIVNSYIVLAPETMLSDTLRQPTLAALLVTLTNRSREQIGMAARATENLIRYAEQLGGTDGFKIIVKDMRQTPFLEKILSLLHEHYAAQQTTGPKGKKSLVTAITATDYLSILARIAVADPAIFVEVLASFAPLPEIWQWLSLEWFGNFDSMAALPRQKLNMLALTRLLELDQPMQNLALGKLQDYFAIWTSVIAELIDGSDSNQDCLAINNDFEGSEWDTPKDVVERKLWRSDPVRTVDAFEFTKQRLAAVVERTGGQQAFQENWAVNVDQDVLEGFQRLGLPRAE